MARRPACAWRAARGCRCWWCWRAGRCGRARSCRPSSSSTGGRAAPPRWVERLLSLRLSLPLAPPLPWLLGLAEPCWGRAAPLQRPAAWLFFAGATKWNEKGTLDGRAHVQHSRYKARARRAHQLPEPPAKKTNAGRRARATAPRAQGRRSSTQGTRHTHTNTQPELQHSGRSHPARAYTHSGVLGAGVYRPGPCLRGILCCRRHLKGEGTCATQPTGSLSLSHARKHHHHTTTTTTERRLNNKRRNAQQLTKSGALLSLSAKHRACGALSRRLTPTTTHTSLTAKRTHALSEMHEVSL